ncbi:MAG: hypothetical protein N2663_07845, partial [Chlorobi bacterium]|nr:hypothetical protein [Chlorobiota bacterium]
VVASAQPCRDCPLPLQKGTGDTAIYVLLRDRTRIENCRSIVRTFLPGSTVQAVRLQYLVNGTCRDTIVPVLSVLEIGTVGLGLDGQPRPMPILPVRQYERRQRPPEPSASFVELAAIGGTTGKDASLRRIGSSQLFPSLEAIVAPFGRLLGNRWSLGLLAGGISDGTRWRIPLGGHLRYWFSPQGELTLHAGYRPDSCTFNERTPLVLSDEYRDIPTPYDRTDPSAAYVLDYIEHATGWQPFLFVEGGTLLNTDFEGAGREPSLNPDDYGQWFVGVGAGTTAWEQLVIGIAYRYQRLNVRTPCALCPPDIDAPNNYVVNTANLHSLLLKIGIHFRF